MKRIFENEEKALEDKFYLIPTFVCLGLTTSSTLASNVDRQFVLIVEIMLL